MMSNTLFKAILLAAIPFAAADFKVFCGQDINAVDGVDAAICYFYITPPSCDDEAAGGYLTPGADVSYRGIACDGCDISKAIVDWDITRLEVHEPDQFSSEHFSTYFPPF